MRKAFFIFVSVVLLCSMLGLMFVPAVNNPTTALRAKRLSYQVLFGITIAAMAWAGSAYVPEISGRQLHAVAVVRAVPDLISLTSARLC